MKPARWITLVVLAILMACGGGDASTQPGTFAVRIAITGPGSIDVTGDATGRCQGTCSMSAKAGGQVVLTPAPDEGATFVGFNGACSGVQPCTLTVSADVDVGGTFAATTPTPTFVLTVTRDGDGSGLVTSEPAGVACTATACSGTFESGTRVKLTATPEASSRFVGWSGPCDGTGTCEVVLSAAVTVTATFAHGAPGTYAVKLLSYPGGTLRGVAIDAAGDVAGNFLVDVCCESQVFLYDAATDQVTLPLPDERQARCETMSDAGMLIVTLDGKHYRFQGGEILSALGDMTPMAMNEGGWAVGWMEVGPGPLHAALDDGTAVRDLDPSGTVPSMAGGINAGGVIVGTRGEKAVVFETGGPRDLPVAPASSAHDVSDDGRAVGGEGRTFKYFQHGFIVELASDAVTLVDPPAGTGGMSFDAINRTGTAVVGQSYPADGSVSPVVYRSGKLERLVDLVELPEGLALENALDVNDAGQILVLLRDDRAATITAILTPR